MRAFLLTHDRQQRRCAAAEFVRSGPGGFLQDGGSCTTHGRCMNGRWGRGAAPPTCPLVWVSVLLLGTVGYPPGSFRRAVSPRPCGIPQPPTMCAGPNNGSQPTQFTGKFVRDETAGRRGCGLAPWSIPVAVDAGNSHATRVLFCGVGCEVGSLVVGYYSGAHGYSAEELGTARRPEW